MKAHLRMLGRKVRLGTGTAVGQIVNHASHERSLMLAVAWPDGSTTWHRPGELTYDE